MSEEETGSPVEESPPRGGYTVAVPQTRVSQSYRMDATTPEDDARFIRAGFASVADQIIVALGGLEQYHVQIEATITDSRDGNVYYFTEAPA